MNSSSEHQQIRVERHTPAYWKVLLENPPFNIFGPDTIPQLEAVIAALETEPALKVVVFESAVPGFFLNHYDFTHPLEESTSLPSGPTGMHPLPDMLVRLTRAPVVSIAAIRGRATGVGSELALACDMRFASQEQAFLSQWEVGAALVTGGGPLARLSRLVGRGRTMEIALGGTDIDAKTAELYGYVNRALPDSELDRFVDQLASRIATFDKSVLTAYKRLINHATLPSDTDVNAEWTAFIDSLQRPEAQRRIKQLMDMGLQSSPDVERRLNDFTGTLGS
ncbi:enoyl-CoA hydratase/isomerase family protein [Paraburkholderia sp. C35]|uniref:enoyl-CoA hydratase/isomerase family protein n=1 Tax=Paraburkholderia sp. C35 TaxID=2126993 RepID=UPI000D6962F4|nr:enoyl-CoA hydratase/isomerase family protein [Paraburkholderia sp. C35]